MDRLRISVALLFAAAVCGSALPARAASEAELARGHALAGGVCAACHGITGNSPSGAFPKLAGQGAGYLLKQLHDFKSGARRNDTMSAFAGALSDADMRAVSAYYAAQPPAPGAAHDAAALPLGQKLYRGGLADQAVPACASCHGPAGRGVPVQYPRLSGQWAEYTAAQLHAFQTGARNNSEPMHQIASRLSDTEIQALADYIAGLH